ncbi:MAG: hypothetical protein QXQ14_02395 [Candidatus Aenigmatarchaeota archaeon]
MDVKFYKSLNKLSKNFSQKITKIKKALILFDENVDGLSSALIFLEYLKNKLDVEIKIYRRNNLEQINGYDLAIVLDIPLTKEKLSMIKTIKNVFWFDDQKPKTFTFQKSIVINSHLFKLPLPTSSLCYFFFKNLNLNRTIIFLSHLGSYSEFYKIEKIKKRFKNYFNSENLDNVINSLHFFLRKTKEKEIEKFLEKAKSKEIQSLLLREAEKYFPKVKKIYKKLKKRSIIEKFEFGITRIAANYLFEKLNKPIIVSSKGKKLEITIRAPQKFIEQIKINELEDYEFFMTGAEIITTKENYNKIKKQLRNVSK